MSSSAENGIFGSTIPGTLIYAREASSVPFSDYQNEIYFNGLRGVLPKLPVDMASPGR